MSGEQASVRSGSQVTLLAGRFALRAEVGVSASVVNLQAVDRVLGAPRCLRLLRPELTRQPMHSRAFSASARTLVGLRHPHLREVHDLVPTERGLAMVLAPAPGPSLRARRRDGPMVIDEVVRIGLDGLTALDFLHQRGFVHGDIDADGAWLDESGQLLLCSPRVDSFNPGAGGTVCEGSLAPELRVDPRLVTPSADLYAWAAVLYELIVGRPHRADVHAWHPKTLGPGVSAALVRVLAQAMSARPSDRPVSACEMARKLVACSRRSGGGPVPGSRGSSRRPKQGHERQHAVALQGPRDRPALVPAESRQRWAMWLASAGRRVQSD